MLWLFAIGGVLAGSAHAYFQSRWVAAASAVLGVLGAFFGPKEAIGLPDTAERLCMRTRIPRIGEHLRLGEIAPECKVDRSVFYYDSVGYLLAAAMGYALGYGLVFISNQRHEDSDGGQTR